MGNSTRAPRLNPFREVDQREVMTKGCPFLDLPVNLRHILL